MEQRNIEISKEKQIEEMAKATMKHCEIDNQCGSCHWSTCNECLAEILYNAGYRKIPDNIGEFSDGYHTFNELYHHRAVLFSVICNMFPEKAWKSKLHDTGDMFDGMFIVGIETEQGQATYHYDIEPYWDMFKVKELDKAPKWDGHTPSDAIRRIGSISGKQSEGEWLNAGMFDDMARYIDADKLLKEVKRSGHALSEWSTLGVCAVIERQPTASVVPKSEVVWDIFDKVDEIAYRYLNNADYSAGDMIYDLNELKKKYTEDK